MGTEAMLETVKQTIEDYHMLNPGEPVLAALSGGADSVALLRALLALGYPVRAFHLNHCLRGAESDRDEAFCRALCERLGVPLTVERIDVGAQTAGEGIEAAARRIRYERLVAAAQGAKIATAHTADDNLETMLFHLARGTGPKGLAGIPPVRGDIIRPLIGAERAQVEAYLSELGQDFVTDSTNLSDDYTRNRIRHEVVPCCGSSTHRCAARRRGSAACAAGRGVSARAGGSLSDARGAAGRRVGGAPAAGGTPCRCARGRCGCWRSRGGRADAGLYREHVQALGRLESADPSAESVLPHGFLRAAGIRRCSWKSRRRSSGRDPAPVPFDGAVWQGTVRFPCGS